MYFCLLTIMLHILSACADKFEPKVVQGEQTEIEKHPYSAFITVVDKTKTPYLAYICGSSILNQKIILSAAHCFETLTKRSDVKVNVGSTDKRKGIIVKVKVVKVHEYYDERRITNDIALAGLDKALVFSAAVNRVALAPSRPQRGSATLAGWGLVDEQRQKGTNLLHETKQNIYLYRDCTRLLKRIPKGTFCGGSGRGYASIGDSGSPLIMNGYLQVGLVSFKKLDISRTVIVYTDTSYFYDWIEHAARDVYCK